MKKLILSSVALVALAGSSIAADLPSQKAPPAVAPAPLWKGFYVGLNAGGTFGNNSAVNGTTWNTNGPSNAAVMASALLSGSGSGSSGNAGFIGGGQIGYNWQARYGGYNFVTGAEADIQGIAGSGSDASRWSATNTDYLGQPVSLLSNQKGNANLSYIGTVRGRLGILIMPTLLIYGTGGLAYGGVNANVQNTQFWITTGGANAGSNSVITGNSPYSSTQVGWAAGGGLEWMFMQNWSAKAEYLYYDLGNAAGTAVNSYIGTGGFSGNNGLQSVTNYTGRVSGNIVRAGVNYHFNFANVAPVIAKF
ncbi:outer-membrane immunogenic protein [Methylocystaceae bacterium]|jgi:outer membrane immunogenic protein|nr:outer-membrane immunogenic protein [Methylocystaceae bacterium]